MAVATDAPAVERVQVSAFEVPLDEPESDATLEWRSVTAIVVEAHAGSETGLGYTYGDAAAATLVESTLAAAVEGCDPMSPPAAFAAMQRAIRNSGRPGVGATAVSAVDIALWDLKAKLLGVPLADALPRFHEGVPVYGSGGFTSYSDAQLRDQLRGWIEDGIRSVKIKVGREPEGDLHRLAVAVDAVGGEATLMVDANGGYTRKQALLWAERYADAGVTWFEEPVSSDDLHGLRLVRDRAPAGIAVAAGEYGWDLPYFEQMLEHQAVDVLQADVTRCGGITNMLRVDGLCKARNVGSSAHCAPAASVHACCAMETVMHIEYFHDHYRVEDALFDGAKAPEQGVLRPDPERPGLGLELKRSDAERFAV